MARKKTLSQAPTRMLSSRVDEEDLYKLTVQLRKQRKSTQELLNAVVVHFLSGNLYFDKDSKIVASPDILDKKNTKQTTEFVLNSETVQLSASL